jgi:NodT family efflux transporter outer membrane factor (OMF) lipoprotein
MGTCACALVPAYRPPVIALMPAYEYGREVSDATLQTSDTVWWDGFHDPVLHSILEQTLTQNLDLAQAFARVDEARAAAAGAGATLWPQGEVGVATSRSQDSLKSPLGEIAHAVGAPRDYDTQSAVAQASWEIDLFGGLGLRRDAAIDEAQAVEIARAAVRIAVTAEAADAYLELRGLQAQLTLTYAQTSTQAQEVDIVQSRLAQGFASDRDLQKAQAEFERVRGSIPSLQSGIDAQIYRLDLLMGTEAGAHRAELTLNPSQPQPPQPAGDLAPAELLRRRPDVAMAERHLAGTSARIGAALSEYYPHLAFSGLVGFETRGMGPLLTGDALQSVGLMGLRWRLFDFGRIDAEVAVARSRDAQALIAYRSTVLRATGEVEAALSRYVANRTECGSLDREITALSRVHDQALDAYRVGAVALTEVLDADRDLLAARKRLAMSTANLARAAVAAFRALGGGWTG